MRAKPALVLRGTYTATVNTTVNSWGRYCGQHFTVRYSAESEQLLLTGKTICSPASVDVDTVLDHLPAVPRHGRCWKKVGKVHYTSEGERGYFVSVIKLAYS